MNSNMARVFTISLGAILVAALVFWATQRMARLGKDALLAESSLHPGERIYLQLRCAQCHGNDRAGTKLAPPLRDLDEHWEAARLARYLVHPDSFIRTDPRLVAQREDYKSTMMPPYPHLPRRERDILIRYLLAPPVAPPDSNPVPAG